MTDVERYLEEQTELRLELLETTAKEARDRGVETDPNIQRVASGVVDEVLKAFLQRKSSTAATLHDLSIIRWKFESGDVVAAAEHLRRFEAERRWLSGFVDSFSRTADGIRAQHKTELRAKRELRVELGRAGGSTSKRKSWADLPLKHFGLSGIALWRAIPDAEHPLEIEDADGRYQIYRDGDQLCCVDDRSGKEDHIKRQLFFATTPSGPDTKLLSVRMPRLPFSASHWRCAERISRCVLMMNRRSPPCSPSRNCLARSG